MIELDWPAHLRFFLALALSFLVGLERETSGLISKGRVFAGVRTYALIGLFGFACAGLYKLGIPWVLPGGIIVMGALALVGYLAKLKEGFTGWTSEVAAVITFVMGALCLLSDVWLPMAIGVSITFLLSEKSKVEKFVVHLDQSEFLAVVRFLILTVIILPVLPNEAYTEFKLNPQRIWQLVILVSSMGFAGYFLSKRLGDRMGLWLSGLLGGIVSSTAVSIAAGRIARRRPEQQVHALQASLIASSVMYIRILVLIWIVSPQFVEHLWLKLVLLAVVGTVLCLFTRSPESAGPGQSVTTLRNPFEIRPALIFASLFVLLSILTVWTTRFYGEPGLLALAGIVGVTDIDPFILSVVSEAHQVQNIAISALLISMMSNTVVKGIYFAFQAKGPRRDILWRYGLWAVLHIPLILLK